LSIFDSQTSVNERLTRVVCLSISLYVYVYIYTHTCICTLVCTLLWRQFSYLIVIVCILSLHFLSFHFFLYYTLLPLTSLSFSLSLSLSIMYLCVSVCFFIAACPCVHWFQSTCVCGTYFIISFSLCCLSVIYAHARERACQRDKQLLLACRDGQLLTVLIVAPNLFGIGNKILTTIITAKQKLQVRQNTKNMTAGSATCR
jgi:hypothetical protein